MRSISPVGLPLPTAGEMSEIDARTQSEYSIPELVLMENAGQRIWERAKRWAGPRLCDDALLVIVAGTGNNGGDALVIARAAWLEERYAVAVVLTRRPESGPAAVHAASCEALGIPLINYAEAPEDAHALIGEADWLFDGLLGTGLSGEVRGAVARLIEEINTCSATVIAIDVPSGVGDGFRRGYAAVQASLTLTVELPKQALYLPYARPFCGEIEAVSIGFPPQLLHRLESGVVALSDRDREALLPPPVAAAHKGARGVLAVFAGAPETGGALLLAAGAASRGPCGYVTAYIDAELYNAVAGRYPSLVIRTLAAAGVLETPLSPPADALLCGPGWGSASNRDELLAKLLESGLPGVLDADGLRVLARLRADDNAPELGGRWVLTPHPGEAALLTGHRAGELLERPVETVRELAETYDSVVVLKAHVTYVADPADECVYVIDGMNPALGTAGSGDVLAGVIAGLLAHGLSPSRAACLGVLIHQHAGAGAARELGWYDAGQVLSYLGRSAVAGQWNGGDE